MTGTFFVPILSRLFISHSFLSLLPYYPSSATLRSYPILDLSPTCLPLALTMSLLDSPPTSPPMSISFILRTLPYTNKPRQIIQLVATDQVGHALSSLYQAYYRQQIQCHHCHQCHSFLLCLSFLMTKLIVMVQVRLEPAHRRMQLIIPMGPRW